MRRASFFRSVCDGRRKTLMDKALPHSQSGCMAFEPNRPLKTGHEGLKDDLLYFSWLYSNAIIYIREE